MHRFILLTLGALACTVAWAAVNLNSATQLQLETLKGVGPSKARAIIEYRQQHGPFTSLQQLSKVPGIGEKTVKRLEPNLTLSGPTQTP